jgi:colanic acid/amylovoran biosynthesis glycosyltransferase
VTAPPDRSPSVLYLCHTFPWVTQTFTIREVSLLRANDLDVGVLAFHRPERLMDDQARAMLAITRTVPPLLSLAFIRPVLRTLTRRPMTLAKLIAVGFCSSYLVRTTLTERVRGVLDVLRGAYAAEAFPAVRHFHAEFADNAATAAMAAAELTGKTFSFKSHSSYNPQALSRKADRATFIALENEFDGEFFFGAVKPPTKLFLNRSGTMRDGSASERDEASYLRVLSVGTLQEKKGQLVLIEALDQLGRRGVPFRCTIVGSGPLESEIRTEIAARELGTLVTLEAYRPHDEVLELYAEHDVFVLPCVVATNHDRDGLPNVLVEAVASGCVVVSCPVSGIPELIEDGHSGLLVAEHDASALATALERLATDTALRARLRRGGEEIISKRFDLEHNVAELARRFREVTAEPG